MPVSRLGASDESAISLPVAASKTQVGEAIVVERKLTVVSRAAIAIDGAWVCTSNTVLRQM